MGSFGGKSLVCRPVDGSSDDRGHLRSRGPRRKRGRGPAGVATPLEEREYGRAAARHGRVARAFGAKRPNDAPDLRVMSRDRPLEIVDQQISRPHPTRETRPTPPPPPPRPPPAQHPLLGGTK